MIVVYLHFSFECVVLFVFLHTVHYVVFLKYNKHIHTYNMYMFFMFT